MDNKELSSTASWSLIQLLEKIHTIGTMPFFWQEILRTALSHQNTFFSK